MDHASHIRPEKAPISYVLKLYFSLFIFTILGLVNFIQILPGFEGYAIHFLYIHCFIMALNAKYFPNMLIYILAVFCFDLFYGFAAFHSVAMALFCFMCAALRHSNVAWKFVVQWAIFALIIGAFELLRLGGVDLARGIPFSLYNFTAMMSLQIVMFPLAYLVLSPLRLRNT